MIVEGVAYDVITEPAAVERHVRAMADEEWDPEDFEKFGEDLRGQRWTLERVLVADVRPQQALLDSPVFRADVGPRIATQRRLRAEGVPIPPLVLRGRDKLIFDGYARWHLFRELGVRACLAYVGRPLRVERAARRPHGVTAG